MQPVSSSEEVQEAINHAAADFDQICDVLAEGPPPEGVEPVVLSLAYIVNVARAQAVMTIADLHYLSSEKNDKPQIGAQSFIPAKEKDKK